MSEDIPRWKENKKRYNRDYMRDNFRPVCIKLSRITEQEYIDIYEQIPNKREWLKECLLQYKKKHHL